MEINKQQTLINTLMSSLSLNHVGDEGGSVYDNGYIFKDNDRARILSLLVPMLTDNTDEFRAQRIEALLAMKERRQVTAPGADGEPLEMTVYVNIVPSSQLEPLSAAYLNYLEQCRSDSDK